MLEAVKRVAVDGDMVTAARSAQVVACRMEMLERGLGWCDQSLSEMLPTKWTHMFCQLFSVRGSWDGQCARERLMKRAKRGQVFVMRVRNLCVRIEMKSLGRNCRAPLKWTLVWLVVEYAWHINCMPLQPETWSDLAAVACVAAFQKNTYAGRSRTTMVRSVDGGEPNVGAASVFRMERLWKFSSVGRRTESPSPGCLAAAGLFRRLFFQRLMPATDLMDGQGP